MFFSVLEDSTRVEPVVVPKRDLTPQHSYDASRNTRARTPSPKPPKQNSISQNYYDPHHNSSVYPSPKTVSQTKRNSIPHQDYDFHNNPARTTSPQPIASPNRYYMGQQDYDSSRNVARSPSPQTSLPNYYMQDSSDVIQSRRPTLAPSHQHSAPYYPQENNLGAPSPQFSNVMQSGVNFHALTLGRNNSNNSLHYSTSSGYSSHHTTPACSEDTIASHGK